MGRLLANLLLPACRGHLFVNRGIGGTSSAIYSVCAEHMVQQVCPQPAALPAGPPGLHVRQRRMGSPASLQDGPGARRTVPEPVCVKVCTDGKSMTGSSLAAGRRPGGAGVLCQRQARRAILRPTAEGLRAADPQAAQHAGQVGQAPCCCSGRPARTTTRLGFQAWLAGSSQLGCFHKRPTLRQLPGMVTPSSLSCLSLLLMLLQTGADPAAPLCLVRSEHSAGFASSVQA